MTKRFCEGCGAEIDPVKCVTGFNSMTGNQEYVFLLRCPRIASGLMGWLTDHFVYIFDGEHTHELCSEDGSYVGFPSSSTAGGAL